MECEVGQPRPEFDCDGDAMKQLQLRQGGVQTTATAAPYSATVRLAIVSHCQLHAYPAPLDGGG